MSILVILLSRVLILIALASGAIACSSVHAINRQVDGIDATYLVSKDASLGVDSGDRSAIVVLYRQGLGQILGSHCQYYPSDSLFFLKTERSCGSATASVLAAARMFNEYDYAALGGPEALMSSVYLFAPPANCDAKAL